MELEQFIFYLSRWIHFLTGVAWIGLLYYFNFVQTEYFKVASADAKADAISKLVPRALWWFRFGALFTLLSGLALAYFIGRGVNFYITLGMLLGTLMFLNVWLIIWPNQKIVIASNQQVLDGGEALPNATVALGAAGLASRTNTLFSIPMLFFMGASAHLGGLGRVPILSEGGASTMAIGLSVLLVLLLELNAIKGRMGPMASVAGVIHSGLALTVILFVMTQYL